MKNALVKRIVLLYILFGALHAGCKKKGTLTPLDISGILYTDRLGNPIGAYGDPTGDWGFSTNLTARELELFNFADSVNMSSTTVLLNPNITPAYPNPTKNYIGFAGTFGSSFQFSKLKVVIVDPFFNVAYKDAILVSGSGVFYLSLVNPIFQANGVYRIYYSLSAKDNPNYKVGYGDFQICPGTLANPNCP